VQKISTQQNYFSHIQILITFELFPNPTHKVASQLGLQVGERILIATHLDQSNHPPNQKQGCVYLAIPGLLQGYKRKMCIFFIGSTDEPHPRFPVQGHKLNIGGVEMLLERAQKVIYIHPQ